MNKAIQKCFDKSKLSAGEKTAIRTKAAELSTNEGIQLKHYVIATEHYRDLAQAELNKIISKIEEAPKKETTVEEIKQESEPKTYGSSNTIFTEEKANKAREILKKKLSGTQLNVGIDPEILSAGIDLAGYHVEAGARSFADYSKKMIEDIGDAIKPYLKSFYMAVRNYPGIDKTGMNTEVELDAIKEEVQKQKNAYMDAVGIMTAGKADRAIEKGYKFAYGESSKEIKAEMTGMFTGSSADKLIEKGITIVKDETPYGAVADAVANKLENGTKFTRNELFTMADESFGGTLAEGQYSAKDAYDALEMGVNKYIESCKIDMTEGDRTYAKNQIEKLKGLLDLIPTQSTRTEEMEEWQQFSTPPPLSYVANWVANLNKNDVYLEPSAGTGDLAIFAKIAGVKETIVNELAPRRSGILKELGFDKVYTENAEQLNNILPEDIKPTVVVMNPPFSSTAGRMKGERKTSNATVHIEQCLKRIEPGGRLVAIVGEGMASDKSAFSQWWKKIGKQYNVRANIGISGKEYAKYGTSFDNQIIVIDKPLNIDKSTENSIINTTGKVDKIEDLINLLEGVRNERINPGKQREIESGKQKGVEGTQAVPGRNGAVLPATGGLLSPKQPGRPGRKTDNNAGANARLETKGSNELSGTRRGNGREEGRGALETGQQRSERTGGPDTNSNRRQSGDNAPVLPEESFSGEGLTVEQRADVEKNDELTDAVYNTYTPAKLSIPNSQEHPGKLVESAAMASVEPIDPTYSPKLPDKAIKSGAISIAQLEAIVYAGQAHSEILPNGSRKGYFIGDGTGVGKGREIAAILWDNWNQGRHKALWLSQNIPLMKDAQRDIAGVGWDKNLVFDIQKTKLRESIKHKEGIGFLGYGTLRTDKIINERTVSRLDQLVNWLGKDFDGVIVFDEAHNMGNVYPMKGKRGNTKPSTTALTGVELQKQLPNARVLYVSATGATEVANLGYAERLGLWGDKTPFPQGRNFATSISSGGISAMEMVAMNMKANGVYIARSLAYDDVKYERLQHDLTPEQRKIYDELAGAWAIAQRDIEAAMIKTGILGEDHTGETKTLNKDAKSHIMGQFWGTNQRFWNQVITAMQMPTVVKSIEKDIELGHAPLIQLINTNQEAQKRAISGMEEEDSLENLDITPKEMLIEYVKNSFPVFQFETYLDDKGNEKSRIVVDSKGQPVLNQEAVNMREELLTKIASIRVPDGPLEIILDHFGVENVAEITGRTRRVVYKDTKEGRKRVIEAWGKNKGISDADAFMNDKKKILVFSQAGGTGRSYHADNTAKNKRLRRHYLIQPGWRADVAVQGLGRSHRTNQAQAPEWVLVTTNLEGQKRFISSIARRLSQLGALTKGSRETGNQGLFNSRDNLESTEAKDAFHQLIRDIYHGEIDGMSMGEFMDVTGLNNIVDKQTGALNVTNLPDINQFLNRILNMKIDTQNNMFGEFSKRLNVKVVQAIENGTLDVGVETIRAKKIEKLNEQVVYEDPNTKAKATYLDVELTHDAKLLPFQDTLAYNQYGYAQNIRSGRIWALAHQKSKTDYSTGDVTPYFSAVGANYNYQDISDKDVNDPEKFKKIPKEEARAIWNDDYEKMPKEVKERIHMVIGSILPVWDRLPQGEGTNKIYRLQVDGKNIIGRVIPNKWIDSTLKKLGAQRKAENFKPTDVFSNVLNNGYSYQLSNGWEIKRRKVADDYRIELEGPDYFHTDELKKYGVFNERISYTTRYFIPTDKETGINAIKEIISSRPIIEEVAKGQQKKGDVNAKDVEFLHEQGKYSIKDVANEKDSALAANNTDGIIENKGDQNGQKRNTANNQVRGSERNGILPEVHQEREQRVGAERQRISEDAKAPYELRDACRNGQGIVYHPDGYEMPEYTDAKALADLHGLDVIPVIDTSGRINAFIDTVGLRGKRAIFLNMDLSETDMAVTETVSHEISHFLKKTPEGQATRRKIDTHSPAFIKYWDGISKCTYNEKDYNNGQRLSIPSVIEEYAADLESGIKTHYGATLAEGLFPGATVETITERMASSQKGEGTSTRGPPLGGEQKYSIREQQDPPISSNPKVLNLYLKDEADAIVTTILNKLHPKSMTFLETMLRSPEWFDHPQISRIVGLFMRDRNEKYHTTFNSLNLADNIDAPENTVSEAGKMLKRKGLSLSDRMAGKESPEYKMLTKFVDYFDTSAKKNPNKTAAENLADCVSYMKKHGATDDVVRVWKLYRQSYDMALDLQTKQMRDMISQLIEEAAFRGEQPNIAELKQTLKYALAEMEAWKGYYAPRIREAGDWKVQAYKAHGPLAANREYYREHRGSELSAQRLGKKLEREGWKVYSVSKIERLPESVYQDVKAAAAAKLIDSALDKVEGSNNFSKINSEVLKAVADEIRARGFRSHMMHRESGQVIKGYIADPIERHLLYTNQLAGGLSKAYVARRAFEELLGQKFQGQQVGGIDPLKDPKAYQVATDYIEEQLRNMDGSDRVIALAKSIATFKFLGFNIRSLAVNLTAIMTTAPAAIHQYAMGGHGSLFRVIKELGVAGKDFAAFMAGRELASSDEQAFLEDMHKKGWDDAQYTRDALGTMAKTHSKIWPTLMDGSMYLFGQSEKWNRGTTHLAAYRLARKQGDSRSVAAEKAHDASDKAHGVYGRATNPMWAQGSNPAAKIGQMMYVYGKFSHNYLQMLYDMGLKRHNIKGAMFAFLSPLVLAGGAALPFKDAIFAFAGFILKSLFGEDRDPEKWVWDEIRKHLGSDAEALGRHGLTGASGIDISGSLSIGVGIPKNLMDLTGAIGGMIENVGDIATNIHRGQPVKAIEAALPSGISNIVRAGRERVEGASTRANRRVWDDRGKPFVPTIGESAARSLGFRSTRQAVMSERTWEGHREQTEFADKRKAIYEEYRGWLLGGKDETEHKKIVRLVREYNNDIKDLGHGEVSRITFEAMRSQAKSLAKPSKKEKSLLAN